MEKPARLPRPPPLARHTPPRQHPLNPLSLLPLPSPPPHVHLAGGRRGPPASLQGQTFPLWAQQPLHRPLLCRIHRRLPARGSNRPLLRFRPRPTGPSGRQSNTLRAGVLRFALQPTAAHSWQRKPHPGTHHHQRTGPLPLAPRCPAPPLGRHRLFPQSRLGIATRQHPCRAGTAQPNGQLHRPLHTPRVDQPLAQNRRPPVTQQPRPHPFHQQLLPFQRLCGRLLW